MTCIDCGRKGCKHTWDGVCIRCRAALDKRRAEILRRVARAKKEGRYGQAYARG